MRGRAGRHPIAFSLVELVIVVAIVGTIAAIAVPRISNVGKRSQANGVRAALAAVRQAIDRYYAEHGRYPGYNPTSGIADSDFFVPQLMMVTDEDGEPRDNYGYPWIHGPYLRPPFPTNPVNGLSTVYVKATPGAADPPNDTYGWVAVLSHGYFGISASDTELDKRGLDVIVDIRAGELMVNK
ncbi:MAG: type IV pilin protein [Phycisphaerae bacterium]